MLWRCHRSWRLLMLRLLLLLTTLSRKHKSLTVLSMLLFLMLLPLTNNFNQISQAISNNRQLRKHLTSFFTVRTATPVLLQNSNAPIVQITTRHSHLAYVPLRVTLRGDFRIQIISSILRFFLQFWQLTLQLIEAEFEFNWFGFVSLVAEGKGDFRLCECFLEEFLSEFQERAVRVEFFEAFDQIWGFSEFFRVVVLEDIVEVRFVFC